MAALMEVTQADRDFAADYNRMLSRVTERDADNIRCGWWDDTREVQQVVAHRLAHSEPRPVAGAGDGTAFGEVQCHCSDDDGVPDVGVSLGLGCAKALWIGELLTKDGATCGMVFHNGTERIVAPFADGTDWQEVADILRHHVGPALASIRQAFATHSPAPTEAAEAAEVEAGDDVGLLEAARDVLDARQRLGYAAHDRYDLWEVLRLNVERLS